MGALRRRQRSPEEKAVMKERMQSCLQQFVWVCRRARDLKGNAPGKDPINHDKLFHDSVVKASTRTSSEPGEQGWRAQTVKKIGNQVAFNSHKFNSTFNKD